MTLSIRQLVDRFYEIVNGAEGDFSEIFTPNFQFGIMKGFPYGGNHDGLIATNKFFEDLGAHFNFWNVDTDRFIEIDDSNIVVTGKYRSQASATSNSFEMETVHLWTAKNGMLTSYKHYCDTAIVSKALDHKVPQY
jgi:ketosteroid isomerase-like protein